MTQGIAISDLQEGSELPKRAHTPSNAELFFYNAALWNAHRIHYDLPYAQNEEGYDGLVIAGPQMGDWMTQVIDNLLASATDGKHYMLAELDYSNRAAAYIGETLTTGGSVTAVDRDSNGNVTTLSVELFVKNQQDSIITPGKAVVRRYAP